MLIGAGLLLGSGAAAAPPITISALTLGDSPQAGRFTSGVFPIAMTTSRPVSSIKLKAWVTGNLAGPVRTSAIASVGTIKPPVTYSATRSGGWDPAAPLTNAFDGDLATGAKHLNGQPEAVWNASSYGLSGAVEMYGTSDTALTADHTVKVNGTAVTFKPGTSAKWVALTTVTSLASVSMINGSKSTPTMQAIKVGGVLLVDGATYYTVTMTDATGLSSLVIGDPFVVPGKASGVIAAVNPTTKVVTLAVKTGAVAAGDVPEILTRNVTAAAGTKLYLSFTSAGLVSSNLPTFGDPGFQTFTMTGSYAGTLTFPDRILNAATDNKFGSGTSLSIQMQVSDGGPTTTSTVVVRTPV